MESEAQNPSDTLPEHLAGDGATGLEPFGQSFFLPTAVRISGRQKLSARDFAAQDLLNFDADSFNPGMQTTWSEAEWATQSNLPLPPLHSRLSTFLFMLGSIGNLSSKLCLELL